MTDKPKTRKVRTAVKSAKTTLEDIDFSPNSDSESVEQKQSRRTGRPAIGKNDIVKSRLALIIDMLSGDDDELDEKTLRRNVTTSLKHLKEVVGLL